ncbi:probable aspartic proteinase GIP2 [Eucalyptus grandis]|uniref:probable aspartic proteinase GIP2 n=1 Tax=Eucalyptus grandis TaxID=71139 RepID=UPI00192F06CA|nr:probable aspartic proteinase GIP2 [Eucalyptus grandis]
MASSSEMLSLSFFLFLTVSQPQAKTFQPKALLLPVTKDSSLQQYTTQIKQRTPLVPIKLTIDVGGNFMWVKCEKGYVSSSYRYVPCGSKICKISRSGACVVKCPPPHRPGCNDNACSHFSYNPYTRISTLGEMAADAVLIQSTDGRSSGPMVFVPGLVFSCTFRSPSLLKGLSSGAEGIAGLGRSLVSLPSLFASAFKFQRIFAMCLSSSSQSNGVIIFGDGPYEFQPKKEVSKSLMYTPLVRNPKSTRRYYSKDDPSTDYFIRLTSIKINGRAVPLNMSLLHINEEGKGGTKISTFDPYTVMESSIFMAVLKVFMEETKGVTRVPSVKPFQYCISSKNLGSTRVGPPVPTIDLGLHHKSVSWRIFGANSMVQLKDDVLCLGFVDGGLNPRTSVVIGGHQLEDNLLQFDLVKRRLGFTSSLLYMQTTCTNFNFTSSV